MQNATITIIGLSSATTRMTTINHDRVLDGLNAFRSMLERASDSWSSILEIATVAVFVGVVVELIATILEVIDDKHAGHRVKLHHVLTFIGAGLVATFLAVEGIAEFKNAGIETELRGNAAQAQSYLNEKANSATKDAIDTAQSFGGLHKFVSEQEAKNQAAIADLTRKAADLNKARADALAAAKKAKNDLKALNSALARQESLTAKIETATEKMSQRRLTKEQIGKLATLLRPWAIVPGKGQYVGTTPLGGAQEGNVGAYPDTGEAEIFAEDISRAIEMAHWQTCCMNEKRFLGMSPPVGDLIAFPATPGVTVVVPKSPRSNLVGNALVSALNAIGVKAHRFDEAPDAGFGCEKDARFEKKLPNCTWVSIVVGEHP